MGTTHSHHHNNSQTSNSAVFYDLDGDNLSHCMDSISFMISGKDNLQLLPAPSVELWSIVMKENITLINWQQPASGKTQITVTEMSLLDMLSHCQQHGCVMTVQSMHCSMMKKLKRIVDVTELHFTPQPQQQQQEKNKSKQEKSINKFCFLIKIDALHPSSSSLSGNYCFATNSAKERTLWMKILKRFLGMEKPDQPRAVNSIHLWIQELKQVPAKKRYYCEVLLDGVVSMTTSTKTMSEMLLWAEEFHLDDLPDVNTLSVHVYKEADPKKRRDKTCLIGGVNILTSDLLNREQDQWHYVVPADMLHQLHNSQTGQVAASPIKKISTSSLTNAIHILSSGGSTSTSPLSLSMPTSPFTVPVSGSLPQPSAATATLSTTHTLQHSFSAQLNNNTAPLLRLKARWQSVRVMPLANYALLRQYLTTQSVAMVKSMESLGLPGPAKCQEELASCLVRILHCEGLAVHFLTKLIMWDMEKMKEENLSLRGNSIATKSMEEYLRLLSDQYLAETLSEFVDRVTLTDEDCEVDPVRISSSHNAPMTDSVSQLAWMEREVSARRQSLLVFVEFVWGRIRASHFYFPSELRETFIALRQNLLPVCLVNAKNETIANDNSNSNVERCLNVLSACVFLRLICPAILSPSMFGLLAHYPEKAQVNRTFTLVAKSIQTLANGSMFGQKENYMLFMNEFLSRNAVHMREFLAAISSRSPLVMTPTPGHVTAANYLPSAASLDQAYELARLQSQLTVLLSSISVEKLSPTLQQLQKILQAIQHFQDANMTGAPQQGISPINGEIFPPRDGSPVWKWQGGDDRTGTLSSTSDGTLTSQRRPDHISLSHDYDYPCPEEESSRPDSSVSFENDYDEPYEPPPPPPSSLGLVAPPVVYSSLTTSSHLPYNELDPKQIEKEWCEVVQDVRQSELIKRSASAQLDALPKYHELLNDRFRCITSTSQPICATMQPVGMIHPSASSSSSAAAVIPDSTRLLDGSSTQQREHLLNEIDQLREHYQREGDHLSSLRQHLISTMRENMELLHRVKGSYQSAEDNDQSFYRKLEDRVMGEMEKTSPNVSNATLTTTTITTTAAAAKSPERNAISNLMRRASAPGSSAFPNSVMEFYDEV